MDVLKVEKAFVDNFFADYSVREQFLFFIAYGELREKAAAQKILCLYGVPGAGKRTMLHGMSKALGWKLVTIKLGDVTNDNGQVVGTFRTDLNAIAARVVHALDGLQGQKVALLLEDLDKINPPALHSSEVDFFEILKQMQQYAVQNNYKQNQIDLSAVTFLATVKNLATVPSGLRKQLQVVNIPSYCESDKLKIIKQYILPRLTTMYDLQGKVEFSHNALIQIIREYSREGGIAQVQQELEIICKKLVIRLSSDNLVRSEKVYCNRLEKYLGPPRYPQRKDQDEAKVGSISLLGRSDKGGCTLVMETIALHGGGRVVITGNTDKLFEESAMVAVSHLRTCAHRYNIDVDFFSKFDLHLHMQYGQVPKYGVSAGSGIITAIVSTLSGASVKANVGVTGEISLNGRILGVNDIRDKVLGACQAGLTHIFLPEENKRDVYSLSKDIVKSISISLVDDVHDLLDQAILW